MAWKTHTHTTAIASGCRACTSKICSKFILTLCYFVNISGVLPVLIKAYLCNIFLFVQYFFAKNIACSKRMIKFAKE